MDFFLHISEQYANPAIDQDFPVILPVITRLPTAYDKARDERLRRLGDLVCQIKLGFAFLRLAPLSEKRLFPYTR